MRFSMLLPRKFGSRLICMTFIVGLIPVIIFALFMNLFVNRFPIDTSHAIHQGHEDQWRRSETVLRKMAEDYIRQKAMDVALQLDLYLQIHPEKTVEGLQNDPEFRAIAIQPVGKTGYTAVHDSASSINRFHKDSAIENMDLHYLAEKLPGFWAIVDAGSGGSYSKGYYKWVNPDGSIRDKFMYLAPLSVETSDGVLFEVAATTYIDEFTQSIQVAREISQNTSNYAMKAISRLANSFRNMAFLFMGLGMIISLVLAFIMGRYFSGAISEIRKVTKSVNKGEFNLHAKEVMSGEMGELTGDFNKMVDYLRDTTVKKEALEASEQRYRDIIGNMEEGYYEVDIEGNFTFVNDSICQIYGLEREKVIGTNNREYMDDETAKRIYEVFNSVYKTGEPCRLVDWIFTLNDGSRRYIEMSASLIKDWAGKPLGFRGISRDISERRLMHERLRKEKDKFESLAKYSPYGMSIINPGGKYEYINDKFTKIFGYTSEDITAGRDWFRLAYPDPEYRKKAISAWIEDFKEANPGEINPREFKVTCKDGSINDINIRSVMLENNNVLVTYEDVTEKRKLEEQLMQAQKMEAIGTLAGGIAHDFNNLLTAILGNTSLMSMDIDSRHPSRERLNNIEQYVQSGAELTRQLLSFARRKKFEVKASDLNELIKKTSEMFGRTAKEIVLHYEFQKGIWAVDVDQVQIEQVLMNLYVNAWQAMPDGGNLYIQTENLILDENYVHSFSGNPGRYVKVSVTDTGIGMDRNILNKIFEPFFTTKEVSKGTGLGLTTAYGIMRNHGGTINAYSEKGEGTTFNLYLPVSIDVTKSETLVPQGRKKKEIVKGNETIMLVDDEDMILEVGKAMLESMGYNVILTNSGSEMIETISQSDGLRPAPDLIILDMIMPDMGGGEAFDKVREINPNIKVLLSSGYSINGQATRIMERGCNGYIQKPFNISQLSKKIREILEKDK